MKESSLLPLNWEVPQLFRDRLGIRVGRQRAMAADGHLLLVLHAPPDADETERSGRFFWLQPDGNWSSKGLGSGPQAVRKHLEEYATKLDGLEDMELAAEGAEQYFEVIRKVIPFHRAAANLHVTLQQARELFPESRDVIDFRDRAYQISRNAELLHSLTKEGLEREMAQQSEKLARSSYRMSLSAHRLNMLAAFFFPIMTLSTIFGMNFKHGYEAAAWPNPFLMTIGFGLILGLILTAVVKKAPRSE